MIGDGDAPRVYVHGATVEEWRRRFGVEPFRHPCSGCGRVLETTLPFAQGTLRGIAAPPCACGNVLTPYAVVRDPRHGDLLDPPRAPALRPVANLRREQHRRAGEKAMRLFRVHLQAVVVGVANDNTDPT